MSDGKENPAGKTGPIKKGPIRLNINAAYKAKEEEVEDVVTPRSISRPAPAPKPEPAPATSSSAPKSVDEAEPVFKFYCVYCGQKLSALRPMAGKRISCPSCEKTITIPEPP